MGEALCVKGSKGVRGTCVKQGRGGWAILKWMTRLEKQREGGE